MPVATKQRSSKKFHELDLQDPTQVVNFLKDRWRAREWRRATLERQWYLQMAFYLGYQWHEVYQHSRDLYLPNYLPWRARIVANRLQGIVRKRVAQHLKTRPTWVARAATGDIEDIQVAQVATKVLQGYWHKEKMPRHLVDSLTWTGITGNSFIRVVWDPTRGQQMATTPEDLGLSMDGAIPPELLQAITASGLIPFSGGDLFFESRSPFEIDPDEGGKKIEDLEFLIDTSIRSPGHIRDRYGVEIDNAHAKDQSLTKHYLDRISNFTEPDSSDATFGSESDDSGVAEHTLWVRPCKKYPKGLWVVTAADQEMARGELDTPAIPYIHLMDIPVPGRFWATSSVAQCLELQRDYNTGRSKLVDWRNLMANPKWLVAKGAGIKDSALTDEPDEVVEYTYPFKPEQVAPPPIPESVFKTLDLTLRDIEDVSGQREVSNARVPTGVRSGTMIAQLEEQDESLIAPTVMLTEEALGLLGSYALHILHRRVDAQRLVKYTGKDNEVEAVQFTGRDIVGKRGAEVDYFDVKVELGSQLPLSKGAKHAFIMDLVQVGVLDPKADRSMILTMLDIGSEEPVYEESRLDRNAIFTENNNLDQGIGLAINPWDNDLRHIEGHRLRQKQPDYQRIVALNPVVGVLYEQHISDHVDRAARAQGMLAPPTGGPTDDSTSRGPGEMPPASQPGG